MRIVVWVAQSFLLSFAIFFLFGEEFVSDHRGGFPCHKVIPAAADDSSGGWNKVPECCKMEKSAKWQILFGSLSVAQTTLLSVVSSIRLRNKSPLPFLNVACTACWTLTLIVLLTKLLTHLSPQISALQITENGNYESTLFTFARDALNCILKTAFQRLRLFTPSKHSVLSRKKANTLLQQKMQDGLYFCSSELNGRSFEQVGVNTFRAMVVLIAAYVLSSGYTLCLVLGPKMRGKQILKPVDKSTAIPTQLDKATDRECDHLDVRGVGGEHTHSRQASNKECGLRKGIRECNKKEIIVAFMEEESDEDSFVFGWRL